MATYVNFFKGTHDELPTSNYKPGAFYLTTDTSRLYFADTDSKLLDLNKYILFVENIDALPTSGKDGDIYYCKEENVLATYIKGINASGWQQINRNTDTDTQPTEWSQSVTSDATNGVSVTLTLHTRVWNEQTRTWVTGSDQSSSITFNITQEDIYDVIPKPEVDVTAALSDTNIVVTTTGDGSAGDGFTLKPGNGVTFDGSTDDITIHGKTYSISSPANSTTVEMKDEGSGAAGSIAFEAGNQLVVSGTDSNKIKYTHATISTDTSTTKDAQSGFGAAIEFVKALGWDNGHLTDYDLGSLQMPAEPNYHVTSITAQTGAGTTNSDGEVIGGAGSISVGIQDSQGSKNGNTLTSGKILYYKVGANADTKIYNTDALPVYTITEINTKFNQFDSMHYMGTVNGSTSNLPTANVKNGDTYKNIADGQEYLGSFINVDGKDVTTITAEMGDLFIATGTEDATTGYITGTIKWSYVPSGDDLDSKYEFSVGDNKVTLVNKSTPTDNPGDVTFGAGLDLNVSTDKTAKSGATITFKHNTHAGTQTSATATPDYGDEIVALSGVTLSNGHIDGYTLTKYTIPAVNVGRIAVLNEANKPTIQLSDTRGNSSQIAINHDAYVIATPTDEKTITFSHSSHAGTKNTNTTNTLSFGGEINTLVGLTLDNGHVNGYHVTPFVLPRDPSAKTLTTGVEKDATSGAVTVTETINQPYSENAQTLTTSHSFSTNTASMSLTPNGTNIAIDLVWGSFTTS